MGKSWSICTVVQNRCSVKDGKGYLPLFLRSIENWLAHPPSLPFDIWIVDFMSTDTDWRWLRKLSRPENCHGITRVCVTGPFSLGGGRNTAFRKSSGELLAFLDADILVPEGFFDSMEKRFELNGICFPQCFSVRKDGNSDHPMAGWGNCLFRRSDFPDIKWPEYKVWGGEDTDLFQNIPENRRWREPVEGLLHQWHPRDDALEWYRSAGYRKFKLRQKHRKKKGQTYVDI